MVISAADAGGGEGRLRALMPGGTLAAGGGLEERRVSVIEGDES